jgi:hypothetical protein
MIIDIATILSSAVGLAHVGLGVYSAYFNHKTKQQEKALEEKEEEKLKEEYSIGRYVQGSVGTS